MAKRAAHKKQRRQAKEERKGESFEKEQEIEDTQELKTYWGSVGCVQSGMQRTCFSPCFDASLTAIPYSS